MGRQTEEGESPVGEMYKTSWYVTPAKHIKRPAIMAAVVLILLLLLPTGGFAAPTAVISTDSFSEADIVAGISASSGKVIVITLGGANWIPNIASNKKNISSLIGGFSATSQADQWKLVQSAVNAADPTKIILYQDSKTLIIGLPAVSEYDIAYDQTIEVTIPKSLIAGAAADIKASNTFTVICIKPKSYINLEDAIRSGTLSYWLGYMIPQRIYINVPEKHISSIQITQQTLGNTYITVIDTITDDKVASVSATWNNITHTSNSYKPSGNTRTFTVGFADLPPGVDVTISIKDNSGNKLQNDIVKRTKLGQTTYSEMPKSPLHGWYSLYKLVIDKKLLDSILQYYSLSELTAGIY